MAGTDTYQLILQLRDEMSASLKDVKVLLQQTKSAGQQTSSGIVGLSKSMKQAAAPLKAFSTIMRQIVTLGGAAFAIRQITQAVAEMEAAYEKANPAVKAMEGSAYQFKAAVNESKAAVGGLLYEIISPARSILIQTIQDATDRLKDMNDEANSVGETLGQVGVYAVKAFQVVGRLIYDNFNLMKITVNAMWELVRSVGEFIWLPLKKGFLLIIQPIKQAFLDMVNWILQATTDMVNWIGKKLSDLTGGKVGGGLAKWSAGQVDMKDLAPENVKLKTWGQLMDEVKGTFGEVGDELEKVLNAYVDIFVRKPGEARLYDVKPDEDTAKAIEKLKAEARAIVDAGERERAEMNAGLIEYYANQKAFNEAQLKEQQEQTKLMREERRRAALAAQSFINDPMAGIGDILQEAFESASMNLDNKGNPLAMLSEFISLASGGMKEMLASLAEFGPIILLIITLMEVFKGIQEILGPIIENMLAPFINFLQGIGNVIGTLLLPIFEAFEPALNALGILLNGLLPLFQLLVPIFKAIGTVIKILLIPVIGIIRMVIQFINLIISAINLLLPRAWEIKKIALPDMPTFHSGGVAKDETMALLKKGEVVLNPYKSKSYIAGGGGGGVTINAPNARYIDKSLAADLVRMGLAGMRA